MDKIEKITDAELVLLLKNGDSYAFSTIYNRYWPLMYAHARKMLHDEDEAKDVLQDIFTDLWKRADQIHLNSSLKAYLYTAVRNRIIKLINRGKLRDAFIAKMTEVAPQLISNTEQQVSYNEFERIIEKEIGNLPPRMRAIFEKSHNLAMSHQEIATELNVSEHTVKTTVHRALTVLRAKLAGLLSLVLLFSRLFHS